MKTILSNQSNGSMSDINIEETLNKFDQIHITGVDGESYDTKGMNLDNIKAAIKEIVDLVVDKCAEEAELKLAHPSDYSENPYLIDKESILKVKQLINYE